MGDSMIVYSNIIYPIYFGGKDEKSIRQKEYTDKFLSYDL